MLDYTVAEENLDGSLGEKLGGVVGVEVNDFDYCRKRDWWM